MHEEALPLAAPGESTSPTGAARPLLGIWLEPRRTLRAILDGGGGPSIYLLGSLAGVSQVLLQILAHNLMGDVGGEPISFSSALAASVTLGPVIGLLTLWVGGALLHLTCSWLGGTGSARGVRTAAAWASVPQVFMLLLWIPLLALLGDDLLHADADALLRAPRLLAPIVALSLAQITCTLWGYVLILACLAEAERVSSWRALGALALTSAIVLVVTLLAFVAAFLVTGVA